MATAIQAEVRNTKTKAELRQLRADGKIPGVVYGAKVGSVSISVNEREVRPVLAGSAHGILQLEVPGQGKHAVVVADIQRDVLVNKVTHVDFHQLNMDEEMRTTVPIEYIGDPVGVKAGGIRTVILDQIEIRCMPQDLPASIPCDISELDLGQSISVAELTIPEKVTLVTDAEEVLVTIATAQKEEEETEATEEVEASAETEEEEA